MMGFPFIDVVIALIVIVAVLIGVKEGFLKSIIGLSGIAIALVAAYTLSGLLIEGLNAGFGVKGAFAGVSSNATLAKIFSPVVAGSILILIFTIVLFIVLKRSLKAVERRLKRSRNAKPVVAIDKVLGVASGFIKAIVCIIICFTIITFAFPTENALTIGIQNSMAGKFLYEHNPLPAIIIKYI